MPVRLLASGGSDALVSLWDMEEVICLRTFCRPDQSVRAMSFSSDGAWLAYVSEDGYGTIDVVGTATGGRDGGRDGGREGGRAGGREEPIPYGKETVALQGETAAAYAIWMRGGVAWLGWWRGGSWWLVMRRLDGGSENPTQRALGNALGGWGG